MHVNANKSTMKGLYSHPNSCSGGVSPLVPISLYVDFAPN